MVTSKRNTTEIYLKNINEYIKFFRQISQKMGVLITMVHNFFLRFCVFASTQINNPHRKINQSFFNIIAFTYESFFKKIYPQKKPQGILTPRGFFLLLLEFSGSNQTLMELILTVNLLQTCAVGWIEE